jgi:hypothetical protein
MASTSLTKTFSSSNRKTWTWSSWCKFSDTTASLTLFHAEIWSATPWGLIQRQSSNTIRVRFYDGANDYNLITNRLFRDVSAWYHIVVSVDTTQATASDRIKIYINGVQETSFGTSTYPTQNYDTPFNNSVQHQVGHEAGIGNYYNGEMAHVHFIDGTAYDADTFGSTDSTTGIWKPNTSPSVSYGTNGFFLKFENSGAFGTDSSGNGNTFTVNGTMTQTIDTPSNVFATFNALNQQSSISYSNGNTTFTNSSSANRMAFSNLGVTKGKYYSEIKVGAVSNYMRIGIADISKYIPVTNAYLTNISNSANYSNDGVIFIGSSSQGTFSTFTTNDIVNIALDMDNGYVYFGKNGTWQNSGDPTSGGSGTGGFAISNYSTETYCFGLSSFDGGTDNVANANFGNGYFGTTAVSSAQNPDDGIGIFEYDVPTGYRALCTKSINAEEYS